MYLPRAGKQLLHGQQRRGWRADFDWLMSENNLVKVLEGKYGGSAAPAPHRQNGGYGNGRKGNA